MTHNQTLVTRTELPIFRVHSICVQDAAPRFLTLSSDSFSIVQWTHFSSCLPNLKSFRRNKPYGDSVQDIQWIERHFGVQILQIIAHRGGLAQLSVSIKIWKINTCMEYRWTNLFSIMQLANQHFIVRVVLYWLPCWKFSFPLWLAFQLLKSWSWVRLEGGVNRLQNINDKLEQISWLHCMSGSLNKGKN